MLTTKQRQFVEALQSRLYRYLCFGGAVSGGKSIVCIGILHNMALDYPKTRYAIIRKNYTTLKRTSVPSLRKVAELDNTSDQVDIKAESAVYANGSEILFIDADVTKDADFDKLKGLELTACLIEEANEVDEKAFNILKTRVGRWNMIDGELIPHFILLNCNPSNNWVKTTFYQPDADGTIEAPYFYLQALPEDNEYNSKEYLESLKDLPEAEYQRYAKGNWDFADDPNQLISYEWFKQCVAEKINPIQSDRKILSIDVARSGDDKTVFCYLQGLKVLKFEEYSKLDTSEVALMAIAKIQEQGILPEDVIIDIVGVGAGVFDMMRNRGYQVQQFVGGSKPDSSPDFFRFLNVRAEGYWFLREALRNNEMELEANTILQNEILNIRYSTDEKVIKIEAKEQIKKRIGKSTDYGDALSMAIWLAKSSLQNIPSIYMV